MKYYLGVDPSTTSTGYAVLDENAKLVRYDVINPPKDLTQEAKLAYQYSVLEVLLGIYGWVNITCEDQFSGPNIDTLKKIARTSSMIMLLAAQRAIPLHMTYPTQWRKVFHENGSAKKADTLVLVNELHNLELKAKQNDIADAIGIAHYGMTM